MGCAEVFQLLEAPFGKYLCKKIKREKRFGGAICFISQLMIRKHSFGPLKSIIFNTGI